MVHKELQMKINRYGRSSGEALIQTLGLVMVTVLTGALAIDSGFYYAVHRGEQNAADAAALAAVSELFKSSSATSMESRLSAARASAKAFSQPNMSNKLNDADIEFGFVNPATGAYNTSSFSTPSTDTAYQQTGGYNAVRVSVKAAGGEANSPVPALLSTYVGLDNFASGAQAVALYGGGVTSMGGLRPVYMCQAAWDQAKALYGDPTVPEVTFYGTTLKVGTQTINAASSCGNLGPGNWGLADLENGNGAPGASTVRQWFANGYSGQVVVNNWYESMPGNQLNAYNSELTTLQNNQTVITLPLYSQTQGNGSNATYKVSQMAGFVITGFQSTGNNKYIKGHFKKNLCARSTCTSGSSSVGGGPTSLRMVH
jgi:hypothetical protein